METSRREDEIEDMSLSPPAIGSMQIAGSNGFGHNMEFMSQAYLRNRYSEIDIEDDTRKTNRDRPLPVFLKVLTLLYSCCFQLLADYFHACTSSSHCLFQ